MSRGGRGAHRRRLLVHSLAALSFAAVALPGHAPAGATENVVVGGCVASLTASITATEITFSTSSAADCVINKGTIITTGTVANGSVTPTVSGSDGHFTCARGVGGGSLDFSVHDDDWEFVGVDAHLAYAGQKATLAFKRISEDGHLVGVGNFVQLTTVTDCLAGTTTVSWVGTIVFEDPVL